MAPMYLAFDIGTKRIGLAWGSQDIGVYGSGVINLETDDWRQRTSDAVKSKNITGLVIGVPQVKSGQSPSRSLCLKWATRLKKTYQLPVYFVNEAYSSVAAEHDLRRHGIDTRADKASIDEHSAITILRQFLQ